MQAAWQYALVPPLCRTAHLVLFLKIAITNLERRDWRMLEWIAWRVWGMTCMDELYELHGWIVSRHEWMNCIKASMTFRLFSKPQVPKDGRPSPSYILVILHACHTTCLSYYILAAARQKGRHCPRNLFFAACRSFLYSTADARFFWSHSAREESCYVTSFGIPISKLQ